MKDLTKRYYVFVFSEFYPSGGIGDIEATYDDLDQAIEDLKNRKIRVSLDATYVFDKVEGEIVFDLFEE